jgi:chromate transporter
LSTAGHEQAGQDNPEGGVSFLGIFWTFFRVGILTLGGGLAMATVLRHELVLKRGWIEDDDFMAELSTATIVPGAVAVNMAYLQGRRLRGKPGATVAIFGTILPSFCIILLVAWVALPYFSHPRVAAFLRGCAIAVGGLLAFAGFTFGKRLLRSWRRALVCAVGLAVVLVLKVHPVWAVVAAGGAGYFLCRSEEPENRMHA